MKLVVAYIRPERVNPVRAELFAREIYSMSIMNVLGSGRQKGYTSSYRGSVTEGHVLPKTRIEIGVNDDFEDNAIEAIKAGAFTGNEGDGVIFVMDIAHSVRVRTGETDIAAVRVTRESA